MRTITKKNRYYCGIINFIKLIFTIYFKLQNSMGKIK